MKFYKKIMLFFVFILPTSYLSSMGNFIENEVGRKILLALSCASNSASLYDSLYEAAQSFFAIKYTVLNTNQREEQYENIYNNIGYACIHSMSSILSGLLACYSKTDILGAEKSAVFLCDIMNVGSLVRNLFIISKNWDKEKIRFPVLFHTAVHLLTFASMGYIDNFLRYNFINNN